MSFLFYSQILNQTDLQDIAKILAEPLNKLAALDNKLKSLSNNEKNNTSFIEVSLKVEKLINNHFPNLIESYSKLDLEERNTTIVKKDSNVELTSKDIFVHNINNLIQEIQIANQEFNNNYSYELLVQNRILNNMGVQKKLFSTENEIESIKPVILENNFDYSTFKNLNPQVFLQPGIIPGNQETTSTRSIKQVNSKINKKMHTRIFEGICMLSVVALLVGGVTTLFNFLDSRGKTNYTVNNVWRIINGTQILYASNINYKNVNEKLLIRALEPLLDTDNEKFYTGYNTEIDVVSHTTTTPDDSLKVVLNKIPQESCGRLIERLADINLDKVTVNNHLLSKDGMIDLVNVDKVCNLPDNHFIIEQKENLLQKNNL